MVNVLRVAREGSNYLEIVLAYLLLDELLVRRACLHAHFVHGRVELLL
jgi:hypothetical protein